MVLWEGPTEISHRHRLALLTPFGGEQLTLAFSTTTTTTTTIKRVHPHHRTDDTIKPTSFLTWTCLEGAAARRSGRHVRRPLHLHPWPSSVPYRDIQWSADSMPACPAARPSRGAVPGRVTNGMACLGALGLLACHLAILPSHPLRPHPRCFTPLRLSPPRPRPAGDGRGTGSLARRDPLDIPATCKRKPDERELFPAHGRGEDVQTVRWRPHHRGAAHGPGDGRGDELGPSCVCGSACSNERLHGDYAAAVRRYLGRWTSCGHGLHLMDLHKRRARVGTRGCEDAWAHAGSTALALLGAARAEGAQRLCAQLSKCVEPTAQ